MGIQPARGAILICDDCGKEIKKGATTISGKRMTFHGIDVYDGEALFRGAYVRVFFHAYHVAARTPGEETEVRDDC